MHKLILYTIVKNSAYTADTAETHAVEVNNYLKWLNRIGIKSNNPHSYRDWVPAAIQFTVQNKNYPEYMASFFRQLESLAAYMYICKLQINDRIKRYKPILSALENPNSIDKSIDKSIRAAELTDSEKQEMLKILDGEIYNLTQGRMPYIILRLDSFVTDGAATYDGKQLTIEHVLPQTVADNSDWAKIWPNSEDRQTWCHRLANLVPLSRKKNSEAQNYDFEKKKQLISQERTGFHPMH
ncbi:HNH endonuclease family protein [Candidatus Nitrosoglobus terrae]|uniref:HNH endonuclease family protein n=1 Tax=Candidatus Nitrosoglobus terrae TaxID=1630141 RepID=UPI001E320094|nr:HNH endonuclease family protein [Candidatus Nitrosoglobus terrae]